MSGFASFLSGLMLGFVLAWDYWERRQQRRTPFGEQLWLATTMTALFTMYRDEHRKLNDCETERMRLRRLVHARLTGSEEIH